MIDKNPRLSVSLHISTNFIFSNQKMNIFPLCVISMSCVGQLTRIEFEISKFVISTIQHYSGKQLPAAGLRQGLRPRMPKCLKKQNLKMRMSKTSGYKPANI